MKDLCTPLSRLFSGDPQALFGGLLSVTQNKIFLHTDQTFFDFPPLQNNQFLYVARASMIALILAGSTFDLVRAGVYIMPPAAVGNISPISPGPPAGAFDLSVHLGVQVIGGLPELLSTDAAGNSIVGFSPDSQAMPGPFVVPPGHFLRFAMPTNAGDAITDGSYLVINMEVVSVPLDFVKR